MSSIYRKGRDGYFYYQTYVENPKTGNKDKRIFHSLGTKDREQAKLKQNVLDKKYQVLKNNAKSPFTIERSLKKNRTLISIMATMILTFIISDAYYKRFNQTEQNYLSTVKNNNFENITVTDTLSSNAQMIGTPKKKPLQEESVSDVSQETITNNMIPQTSDIALPKYEIIRIERLPQTFKQGKVFVVIDEQTSADSQLALCQSLTKQYNEFSNIIICIYANNDIGIDLAKGIRKTYSRENQKKYWLSMYTFNTVEGEYFDNYPNRYLGFY